MIAHLSGTLKRTYGEDLRVLVDVSGVGYEVLLPYFVKRALEEEGAEGQPIELEIYYYATERNPKPILYRLHTGAREVLL